jgi:pimeloyl-ACP methyl ester carboxylesterase
MWVRLASLAHHGRSHCTALAVALALLPGGGTAFVQAAQDLPAPGEASFTVVVNGRQIGREQVSLARTASGWVITSSGRLAPPVDFNLNRFEMKYAPDWQPLEMTLDTRTRDASVVVRTSFGVTTAINEVTQGGKTVAKEDQISARTAVLPANVFGAYEALGSRLWGAAVDTELPVYIPPQAEIKMKVRSISDQELSGPGGSLNTRRFELTLDIPGRALSTLAVYDSHQRLVRFEIPGIGLLVVREDAASVAMRPQTVRNPTDADVFIPANGFNLAATLTTPPTVAGRLRHPAILLIGGATPGDRDQVVSGVPIFAQLAKALSDSGHIVVRYDRRGAGQSGGRTETATLSDYADDALATVKWLTKRDDVDKRRIVVAGYGDAGPVALLAASRGKDIDGVVTIGSSGTRGDEFVLRQQERLLNQMKVPAADRQTRIEMQKKIIAAVVSGQGWEGIPDPIRRQADTPLFKSVLTFDPAKVVANVKQPMLIIHGDLDGSIPPGEADRLAELAKARKKAPAPEVLRLAGVNQTLAPGGDKTVTPQVAAAIADWIKKIG